MRNITGPPVEGDDFFDRPRDLGRLCRELSQGANVLLTAPRRVGKTSLILRLCELERAAGRHAAFVNVEGCADELAFAEKLVEGLRKTGVEPGAMKRLALWFRKVRQSLRGVKLGAGGVAVETSGAGGDSEYATVEDALEDAFRRVEENGTPVLLAVDELPEFLLRLDGNQGGGDRVPALLHRLRALRQTYRSQVRWVFLGSIGLDTFVDDRDLRKTINDLAAFELNALAPEEADNFLTQLGQANNLTIAPEHRASIIARLGWPLPHHLQLVFHALVDCGAKRVDARAVDDAFEELLRPTNLSQFDTWRQRLHEQFTAADAKVAIDALRHLCQHPAGRTRAQLLDALMVTRATADLAAVEEQLARLLPMLQRDGYLLERKRKYSFRSFLLREYWLRREVR